MNKTITIFGSAKPGVGEEQYEIAYKLGYQLGNKGINVCTGGYLGVMEAASKGAVDAGGKSIGVTMKIWNSVPNDFLTKEIKCNSIFERVQKLIELGDAFIVLQGGTGTLLELAAVWELSNKGMMDHKPILCFSSLWNKVVDAVNIQMAFEGRSTELVKSFNSIEEIVSEIEKLK